MCLKETLVPAFRDFALQIKSCLFVQLKANLLLAQYSSHDQSGGYEVRSNLRNFTVERDTSLYCVTFQLLYSSRTCAALPDLGALRPGARVCALCTSKAVRAGEGGCRGSGGVAGGGATTWRMLLHPHCAGSWRHLGRTATCDCPDTSSFVFA